MRRRGLLLIAVASIALLGSCSSDNSAVTSTSATTAASSTTATTATSTPTTSPTSTTSTTVDPKAAAEAAVRLAYADSYAAFFACVQDPPNCNREQLLKHVTGVQADRWAKNIDDQARLGYR